MRLRPAGGPPEPWRNSEPPELVGVEPREAHVVTAAASVTWGAGGTRPPHLVWRLANPVAPGRKKGPREMGSEGRGEFPEQPSHRCPNLSSAPDWLCDLGEVTAARLSFSISRAERRPPPAGRCPEDERMDHVRVHCAPSTEHHAGQ